MPKTYQSSESAMLKGHSTRVVGHQKHTLHVFVVVCTQLATGARVDLIQGARVHLENDLHASLRPVVFESIESLFVDKD